MKKDFTALIIMDGFGERAEKEGNAIAIAGTPRIDAFKSAYPHTLIGASGLSVGLPDGQMGNSEVGHTNIGAGRIVYQELTLISKKIEDGVFFKNEELLAAMNNAKGGALHLMGLLSDGGVHSHIDHLIALIRMAAQEGVKNVYVNCFMDGRDTPPTSGKGYIEQLEQQMNAIGTGEIATVSGRYYAMDRDNRWERVEKAYRCIALGEGNTAGSAVEAMQASYDADITDEFVIPTVIMEDGEPTAKIKSGDSIVFFNFRPDRARELTRVFTSEEFDGFERKYFPVHYVCMTQYDATFENVSVAFKPQSLSNTFGEYISSLGLKQFRIAETEKYAHVTFFFNGGVEQPYEGEDRFLIPSPKVATYDLKPEMSAYEVTEKAVKEIESGDYDVMILNFANSDMVGHTGVMDAAVKAVRVVDECVGKVVDAVLRVNGQAIVTADHGNSDMMIDPATHEPFTAHTTNPVPVIIIGEKTKEKTLRSGGVLADLAPTMLDLMGLPKPEEMTGSSLLV